MDNKEKLQRALDYHLSKTSITSKPDVQERLSSVQKRPPANQTRTVPFAVHWENKDGILLGSLQYPKKGASGSIRATAEDIVCQGTYLGSGNAAPVNGTWSIACSDGRTASGSYKIKEAGKGTGVGTDPDGNKVEITWGG